MRKILLTIMLCSMLNAENSSIISNNWQKFDLNKTKKAPLIQEENIDFKDSLNQILAKALENNNGIDKTYGNLDFESENANFKNLNSIYELENSSLFFQKELFIAQNSYNYSNGLVSRYEINDFLLGLNGFFDKQKEQNSKSFGSEFAYSNFIKAYSNYYIPDNDDKNLQLGLSFILPANKNFVFDLSKDKEKINYEFSYSPYSVFSVNLTHKDFNLKENNNDTAVKFGFSFNLNESFSKQLRKKDNALQEVNRYDFLQRTR